MALGLTTEEMVGVLVQSFEDRRGRFSGELQAARHGEAPEAASRMEGIRQAMPGMTPEIFALFQAIVYAVFDVVAALATAVPHTEARP